MYWLKEMPAGDAELAVDGQLRVEVDAVLVLAGVEDARTARLRPHRPQRELDDPGRGREGISLRGKADADRRAGLDPLIADDNSAQVEPVDADIARRAPG